MVYGGRGGVLGAIGTMGIIVGTGIPMFIGGMIMGPLSGWLMKKVDEFLEDKVPTGFEMLINNFSAGILGAILAISAYLGIGPIVESVSSGLGSAVESIVSAGLLPIASVLSNRQKYCSSTTQSIMEFLARLVSNVQQKSENPSSSCLRRILDRDLVSWQHTGYSQKA